MWTKRVVVLAVILVLVAILFSQERASTRTSPPTGYQLVAAPVTISSGSKTWEEHRVFLVDSTSGNVWEYLAERLDNDHAFHSANFQPVPVKK